MSEVPGYAEAMRWLYGLQVHGVKLGLENMRALLAELGHPERRAPLVLVAGTNGKGSVVAMVSAALAASGLRVGTYTSPHLVRFEERIAIGGRPIAAEAVVRHVERLRALSEELLASGGLAHHPTFFELTTLVAWLAFAGAVDVVVAEVGLGGRFDATNASEPDVSAVTTIGLEHTRYLGHTIEAIAHEKAGVMRPGRVCVTGGEGPVLAALRAEADAHGARLVVAQDVVRVTRCDARPDATRLELASERARYGPFDLPLPGRHQVRNAQVATALLEHLPEALRLAPEALARGFSATRWPGRLERRAGSPRIILDGAHNPHAALTLAGYLREFEPGAKVLVFASLEDKDVSGMAAALFPLFEAVVLTRVANKRALEPEAMRGLVPDGVACEVMPDSAAALERGRELAGPEGLVVVAGSLYLIGECEAALAGTRPDVTEF